MHALALLAVIIFRRLPFTLHLPAHLPFMILIFIHLLLFYTFLIFLRLHLHDVTTSFPRD